MELRNVPKGPPAAELVENGNYLDAAGDMLVVTDGVATYLTKLRQLPCVHMGGFGPFTPIDVVRA